MPKVYLTAAQREGRKRILPGQDNRNLGAGWHEVKRP